jgi:hypothetical protein
MSDFFLFEQSNRKLNPYNSFLAISSLVFLPTAPTPIAVAVVYLPPHPGFHPSQLTIFLANISPKPNITPFTNGSKKLIARAEANAKILVRAGRAVSKIVRVAEGG